MKECTQTRNLDNCTCTFSCSRKGICCECLRYHRSLGELPGCYFPKDYEKTGDRSIKTFISIVKERGTAFLG